MTGDLLEDDLGFAWGWLGNGWVMTGDLLGDGWGIAGGWLGYCRRMDGESTKDIWQIEGYIGHCGRYIGNREALLGNC